jgi:hypothetical protein
MVPGACERAIVGRSRAVPTGIYFIPVVAMPVVI